MTPAHYRDPDAQKLGRMNQSTVPSVSGLIVLLVGTTVLTGWALDFDIVKNLSPGWATMKPATAASFILTGGALLIVDRRLRAPRSAAIAATAAIFVILIALASLSGAISKPFQMSQSTAVSLALIAVALLSGKHFLGLISVLAASFCSCVAIVGYLFGVRALYAVGLYSSMALHTAGCILLLTFGILISPYFHGAGVIFARNDSGGRVARLLIPAAILIPLVTRLALKSAEQDSWWPREFSAVIFTVSVILTELLFVLWVSTSLTQVDQRRSAAEKALRRFRDVFFSSGQGVAVLDSQSGHFELANPAFVEMYGGSVDEVNRVTLLNFVAPKSRPELLDAMRTADKVGHTGLEIQAIRQGGVDFPAYLDVTAVKDDADQVLYRIIGVADLTERKRIEEHLRETARLESVGLLAGGIAHDFNNLLTGIIGGASLLQDALASDPDLQQIASTILISSERSAALTRQMLAYSGRGRFSLQRVDLSELVRETVRLIRASIPSGAEVVLNLAPQLPPIEADPVQIQQVVMNLVINGAEALGGCDGAVEVETGTDHQGARVFMCVKDTGAGIDPAKLSLIFDPFFTTKASGHGLGLSAVQGIVRGHKGTIQVDSEQGRGTSFRVSLPACEGTASLANTPERVQNARGTGTVLVVDDEEVVRQTARGMLERAGLSVLTASNGYDAISLFRSCHQTIDLVLLDLSMPLMSGAEVFRNLREIRSDIQAVLSSGFNESETRNQFPEGSIAGFLQKPYTYSRLVEVLREVGPSLRIGAR